MPATIDIHLTANSSSLRTVQLVRTAVFYIHQPKVQLPQNQSRKETRVKIMTPIRRARRATRTMVRKLSLKAEYFFVTLLMLALLPSNPRLCASVSFLIKSR